MTPAAPLGQFLELALPTHDIAASVQFYERLGFTQRLTGDAWPHPYGVLGDGRIHLGLHDPSAHAALALDHPTPCFVHPSLARHAEALRLLGLTPEQLQLGEESLHRLWLRDPGGQAVLMLEARTFSPASAAPAAATAEAASAASDTRDPAQSLCGYFLQLSLPEPDFEAALRFWERAGFVGLPDEELPYLHQPLTSDQLNLAFHAPRTCDSALLVFELPEAATAATTLARLRSLAIGPLPRPTRALQRPGSLLLEAPEGTLLLLVPPHAPD
jgi:catechol 2,3-dioxygenase-like lactoylglutathione lyase family enzyme